MIDTSTPRTQLCRFERQIGGPVSAYKSTLFRFNLCLEDERRKRFIRQMNVKFGTAEPCRCIKCNPDTSNQATF